MTTTSSRPGDPGIAVEEFIENIFKAAELPAQLAAQLAAQLPIFIKFDWIEWNYEKTCKFFRRGTKNVSNLEQKTEAFARMCCLPGRTWRRARPKS